MAGLRLEHIYKVYPNGTKAVSDFSMDIKDQEFIVFVGPSGCGKSTTLRMIAGLEEITAGELYIDDRIVNDVEPKDRDIAMVFQNYALYPHMTVYENMAFGLKLRHVPSAEIHKKVLWAAKILDLVEYLDRKPKAMSGGQRQRVALGRAILRNPKVMLLDEPLSNLDAKLRAQMRSEISKLHEELKTTFIYVTHDQVEAMTLGTRVVVMRLGKVMQIDTPKNLYDYPANLFVAGFIGTPQMNFFNAVLLKNGKNVNISFTEGESELSIPAVKFARVQPKYLNGKSPVIIGLRSEDLSLEPEVVKASLAKIKVRISHFEELGNETLIYADIDLNKASLFESTTRVIIKGTSSYNLAKGDVVEAALKLEKMHIFDAESEETINPRIPVANLVNAEIKNHKIVKPFKAQLPDAIQLEDGAYDIEIPTQAIHLEMTEVGLPIDSLEKVGDSNVVGIKLGENTIFSVSSMDLDRSKNYEMKLDFTLLSFSINGEVVHKSLTEYDKLNAIYINHATAKSFVGDKYEGEVSNRVLAVEEKYKPLLAKLENEYDEACKAVGAVDSKTIVAKNQEMLTKKKNEVTAEVTRLKNELKKELDELKQKHIANNESITKEVNETYEAIKQEEIRSFNAFKEINKERDAYRNRLEGLHQFKINHKLELQNELNKRINLEAISYETEMNALKGNFKRSRDSLLKEYNELKENCYNEAYPVKKLTKEFKAEFKKLNKAYQEEMMRANIIFFFKVDNLVELSCDAIDNKMIQSLGIKVFTKQYIIEVPHDAYIINQEEGLDLTFGEYLDYGNKKYMKCFINDGTAQKEIYVLVDEQVDVTNMKIKFDVTKTHITEKAMDIKIY